MNQSLNLLVTPIPTGKPNPKAVNTKIKELSKQHRQDNSKRIEKLVRANNKS